MTDTKNLHIDRGIKGFVFPNFLLCMHAISWWQNWRDSAQMGNLGEQNKLHPGFSLGFNLPESYGK